MAHHDSVATFGGFGGTIGNHIFVRLCGTLSFFLHVGTTTVPGQRF